jgi:hypothetical protein
LATAATIHLRATRRWIVVSCALLLAAASGSVHAQEVGEITGAVVDSATAKPLPYATVAVVDTRFGANTQVDGTFRIRNVPA